MITIEEAKKQGLKLVGTTPYPDFVIGSKSAIEAEKNIIFTQNIKQVLNSNLKISQYSKKTIKYLTFIYLVFPLDENKGVNWSERSYFKQESNHFIIELKFPDYPKFCQATEKKALQIMAEQTLRGTKKYLSKLDDFNFEKFYADLSELFKKQDWIKEEN